MLHTWTWHHFKANNYHWYIASPNLKCKMSVSACVCVCGKCKSEWPVRTERNGKGERMGIGVVG